MGTYTRDIHRKIVAHAATRASERRRRPWLLLSHTVHGLRRRFATVPTGERAAVLFALVLMAALVPVTMALLR